jgi:C_GCAxxG_C_C family probable redox protein
MIEKDGKRFNCCESVTIKVHEKHPLNGFGVGVMRAISNMGGGGAGWGSICGAVSGGVMAFGLAMGTEGNESPDEFTAIRDKMRTHTQEFLKAFEDKWGYINCFELLGADTRTLEGKAKHEANKAKGIYYCEDFVQWVADKVLEVFEEKSVKPLI